MHEMNVPLLLACAALLLLARAMVRESIARSIHAGRMRRAMARHAATPVSTPSSEAFDGERGTVDVGTPEWWRDVERL